MGGKQGARTQRAGRHRARGTEGAQRDPSRSAASSPPARARPSSGPALEPRAPYAQGAALDLTLGSFVRGLRVRSGVGDNTSQISLRAGSILERLAAATDTGGVWSLLGLPFPLLADRTQDGRETRLHAARASTDAQTRVSPFRTSGPTSRRQRRRAVSAGRIGESGDEQAGRLRDNRERNVAPPRSLRSTTGSGGIWSQVRPSSRRPACFLSLPPHCLKKKGTSARRHWSRRSIAHVGSIGCAFEPDSPPTMTQSMPRMSRSWSGPSSGSSDRNLSRARVAEG